MLLHQIQQINPGNGNNSKSARYKEEIRDSINTLRKDFDRKAEGMEYFLEKTGEFFLHQNGSNNSQKVIATTCVHVPEELIIAGGAKPVRICSGSYTAESTGSEFLPAKSCSLLKSTVGNIHLNEYGNIAKPSMIVAPTTCDQKTQIENVAGSDKRKFYTLEVPPVKDTEESLRYWYNVINKFKSAIEKETKHKITRQNLKKAINLTNRAKSEFRRLNSIRKQGPVIFGTDVILISNTYFFDDIEIWTNKLAALNDELETKLKNSDYVLDKNTPRILLIGAPSIFPNLKIPELTEKLGGIIVADEFCSSTRLLQDPVAVDEWNLYDMIPAIADSSLKPNTCPHFVKKDDFDRKLLEVIKSNNIDGVIYQSLSGCQLYEMESLRISKLLEKNNIPMLYIETYYNPDDNGQLTIRIEAFIDSLKAKKTV